MPPWPRLPSRPGCGAPVFLVAGGGLELVVLGLDLGVGDRVLLLEVGEQFADQDRLACQLDLRLVVGAGVQALRLGFLHEDLAQHDFVLDLLLELGRARLGLRGPWRSGSAAPRRAPWHRLAVDDGDVLRRGECRGEEGGGQGDRRQARETEWSFMRATGGYGGSRDGHRRGVGAMMDSARAVQLLRRPRPGSASRWPERGCRGASTWRRASYTRRCRATRVSAGEALADDHAPKSAGRPRRRHGRRAGGCRPARRASTRSGKACRKRCLDLGGRWEGGDRDAHGRDSSSGFM